MNPEYTILGGNVGGIATAIALIEKFPDADITIYDKGIHNKICGGAISNQFYEYLLTKDIHLDEAYRSNNFIIGTFSKKMATLPCPFVVTTRRDLQEKLWIYAKKIGIKIVQTNIKIPTHAELFTPQTIVATGYTGLTHTLLNRTWKPQDKCIITRFDGSAFIHDQADIEGQYIQLDTNRNAYGWLFMGEGSHINIGYGGLGMSSSEITDRFISYIQSLNDNFGVYIEYPQQILNDRESWGLPLPIKKDYSVHAHQIINNHAYEFIGVGDALGLAHPVIADGIEPAWQSGFILANCTSKSGFIDTKKYKKLVWLNNRAVSMHGSDYYYAKIFRNTFRRKLPLSIQNWALQHILVKHMQNYADSMSVMPVFKQAIY